MIVRLFITLVFILWPFAGIVWGVLDGDWSLLKDFIVFWLVFMVIVAFTVFTVIIWKGDTDADKY